MRRTPQQSAPPVFTEIAAFRAATGIRWGRYINRPSTLQFSCNADAQNDAIGPILTDLSHNPCELWMYRDDVLVSSGPLVTAQVQGPTLTLQCGDPGVYMDRWAVLPGDDLAFTDVDQAFIAKGLIDYYQALDWGDFGIDTSQVTATGVVRTRTYPSDAPHVIGTRLRELADVDDGFEWTIDPGSRVFTVAYPHFTGPSLAVDRRAIESQSATWSIGGDVYATQTIAYSPPRNEGITIVSSLDDPARMAIQGRLVHTASYRDIRKQATLDAKAVRQLATRDNELFNAQTVVGMDRTITLGDLVLGAEIAFSYDFGWGTYDTVRRLTGFNVAIGDVTGRELASLELE